MKNKSPSVNLYKGRGKSFFDRFLIWALNLGRLVVIITEITALSAFLYRFTLDRQLIDLHDKIKQKQAIVKMLKSSEDKYRNLQERLGTASSLENKGKETAGIFNNIFVLAPNDLTFSNLTVSEEYIRLDANVLSVPSLTNFVKALRNYSKVNSVSLDKIENRTSSAIIVFSLRATLKK